MNAQGITLFNETWKGKFPFDHAQLKWLAIIAWRNALPARSAVSGPVEVLSSSNTRPIWLRETGLIPVAYQVVEDCTGPFHGPFLRLLRPKIPDVVWPFPKSCDESCSVFNVFVAVTVREEMKIAIKVVIFLIILSYYCNFPKVIC